MLTNCELKLLNRVSAHSQWLKFGIASHSYVAKVKEKSTIYAVYKVARIHHGAFCSKILTHPGHPKGLNHRSLELQNRERVDARVEV
jgi:hypothetical protein